MPKKTSFKQYLSKNSQSMSSNELAELYAPKGYLSTGLANFDMLMYSSGSDDDSYGTGHYGFPRGRLIQIAGQPSSFKTYFTKMLQASVVRQGGVVLSLTTEFDVDSSFDSMFYQKSHMTLQQQLTEDIIEFKEADGDQHIFFATPTIDEARMRIASFFTDVRNSRKKGFTGPGLIVIDSIANLTAKDDLDNFLSDKEYKNNSYGGDSKILRKFLNSLQKELAELDITLVAVNQVRANIVSGPAAPKGHAQWKPASHEVLEHYFSVILKFMRSGGATNPTQDGRVFKFEESFRIIQLKKRGRDIGSKEVSVTHYNAEDVYGFDDLQCVVDAIGMSKFCKQGSTWRISFDDSQDENEDQIYVKQYMKEHLQEFVAERGRYAGQFACKPLELKAILKESLSKDSGRFVYALTQLCYYYGPAFYQMNPDEQVSDEV